MHFILQSLRIYVLSALLATPVWAADILQSVSDEGVLQFEQAGEVVLADVRVNDTALAWLGQFEGQSFILESVAQDRYGRMVAYVMDESGQLLQTALIEQAMAQVVAYASHERTAELLTLDKADAIDHGQAEAKLGHYAKVQGVVHEVSVKRSHAYLNFGENWKEDFTIYVPASTLKQMGRERLEGMVGKKVTVRGFIHRYYGPRITLFEPTMLTEDAL